MCNVLFTTLFLSGFIVVKMKSHQQNCILSKLNKIINIFVFESFSYDVFLYTHVDIHFENYILAAPTKHEINIAYM